jgi:hypothetical protein
MDLTTVLRECATEEAYRDTCRRIVGIDAYDLHSLDELCRELRTQQGRYLQTADVESMFSDKTHYGYYWKAPLGVDLIASHISLWEGERGTTPDAIKQWKQHLVQKLFDKLKSMEITSVVLSCVHPRDFGVFSPPTLMFLQMPPRPPIAHYVAYCEELAFWGLHFLGNDSVQDADRALWVLYEAGFGHKKTAKAETYKAAFNNDKWVRQRHTVTVLKPHFPTWAPLEQAIFLKDIDGNLAAKIAGCEFEVRIKELIDQDRDKRDRKVGEFRQKLPPKRDGREWGHFETMIEYVVKHNTKGYGAYRDRLQQVRGLRNDVIHDDRFLEPAEIELMIEMTAKLPEGRKLKRLG